MEEAPRYFEQLQSLTRFLGRQDAGYAFAVSQSQHQIKAINQALQEAHPDLQIVDLEEDTPSVLYALQNRTEATALVINGLSPFLIQNPDHLTTLNFSREALWELGVPLLFWVDKSTLARLANDAADFYSQRRLSAVFFKSPPPDVLPSWPLRVLYNRNTPLYESVQLRDQKIALLTQQLNEVKDTLPEERVALQYALPLAELYAPTSLRTEAVQLLQQYHPVWQIDDGKVQHRVALVYAKAYEYKLAKQHLERAIEIHNEKGEALEALSAMDDLAERLLSDNEAHRAEAILQEAIHLAERLKNQKAVAQILLSLGRVYKSTERYDEALTCFLRTDSIYKSINDIEGVANTAIQIADTYILLDDLAAASEYSKKTISIISQVDNSQVKCGIYSHAGLINFLMERYDQSLIFFKKAQEIAIEICDRVSEALVSFWLGRIAIRQDDFPNFFHYTFSALHISILIDDLKNIVFYGRVLGKVLIGSDDGDTRNSALKFLRQAYQAALKLHNGDKKELATLILENGGSLPTLEERIDF